MYTRRFEIFPFCPKRTSPRHFGLGRNKRKRASICNYVLIFPNVDTDWILRSTVAVIYSGDNIFSQVRLKYIMYLNAIFLILISVFFIEACLYEFVNVLILTLTSAQEGIREHVSNTK